jgi:hypothetical protein
MTHLFGLQPPLGRKFPTPRTGVGPRALHPAISFAPVALAGVLLAGSLAQTGLALLRDTARPSVVEAGRLDQMPEPSHRAISESRIRLKKLDDASENHPSVLARNQAH